MIATYIQELLATNNRVIIPNFGAFLVRATSKSKDANTLEEKLKDIYFSPFLKFNDELLEKYIIKKEGVSKDQASETIKEFIEKVKKELDDGKPFIIKDFGKFVADKQGKVVFETAAKEKAPKASDEKKETAKKKTADVKKETEKTTAKKPVAKETKAETKTTAPKETEKVEAKNEETKKQAPETKKEDKESKLKEYKPEPKTEQKQPTKQAAVKKPTYSYKKEKKPVNKGLIWSIAIGLPLAAIFIWAILNFDTVKKVFNKDQVKTEKVAKKKTTAKKKETAKKKTTEKKETADVKKESKKTTTAEKTKKVVQKQKPTPPQKKYYIIAGSFKNEKYAISYLNKLKAEGYNAERLAERNGMHAVSYNSFVDKRKALAEYKFLTQEKKLQAWILYY